MVRSWTSAKKPKLLRHNLREKLIQRRHLNLSLTITVEGHHSSLLMATNAWIFTQESSKASTQKGILRRETLSSRMRVKSATSCLRSIQTVHILPNQTKPWTKLRVLRRSLICSQKGARNKTRFVPLKLVIQAMPSRRRVRARSNSLKCLDRQS